MTETALATIETVKTELATIQVVQIADLFKPEVINPMLEKIETHVRSIPTDISTDKGRKECIALAALVCKSKTFIESSRKKHLEDIQKIVKTVNASSNVSQERLQKLQDETRQPVTEWENADKARIADLEENLAAIASYGERARAEWQTLATSWMNDVIALITREGIDWQEYGQRSKLAISTAVAQIKEAIAQREKYDDEQAELAALRAEAVERANREAKEKSDREEKERTAAYATVLLQEANAKAERERKAEADKAEAARLQLENEKRDAEAKTAKAIEDARIAAEKAESDRVAAEAKAKADQEAAIECERQRVADEAETERKATEAREKDKKHRATINREALTALTTAGIDSGVAKQVVELIAKRMVPHVSIQY